MRKNTGLLQDETGLDGLSLRRLADRLFAHPRENARKNCDPEQRASRIDNEQFPLTVRTGEYGAGLLRHSRAARTTDEYMQEIPEIVQATVNAINAELRVKP